MTNLNLEQATYLLNCAGWNQERATSEFYSDPEQFENYRAAGVDELDQVTDTVSKTSAPDMDLSLKQRLPILENAAFEENAAKESHRMPQTPHF